MRPRVFPAEDHGIDIQQLWAEAASMRPRVFPAEDVPDPDPTRIEVLRFNEAAGIPRGRPQRTIHGGWSLPRFNEAAGIPRGRPRNTTGGPTYVIRGFNEAAGIPRGRLGSFLLCDLLFREASMRPRVFPAEDRQDGARESLRDGASMRPRVFPAEDAHVLPRHPYAGDRFNEAAGIPRGRPHRPGHREQHVAASMRPRVFPAEDMSRTRRVRGNSKGFNEAAGIPRGRLDLDQSPVDPVIELQ